MIARSGRGGRDGIEPDACEVDERSVRIVSRVVGRSLAAASDKRCRRVQMQCGAKAAWGLKGGGHAAWSPSVKATVDAVIEVAVRV